jgi:hypothetical protein
MQQSNLVPYVFTYKATAGAGEKGKRWQQALGLWTWLQQSGLVPDAITHDGRKNELRPGRIWSQSAAAGTGRFVADCILIIFGCGITILMQASSTTTSTLTLFVDIGLIRLEKMFPFTACANVGTTVTCIMSAIAGSDIATGMTVAFSQRFFNLIGTLILFPILVMRRLPIDMAKLLDWMDNHLLKTSEFRFALRFSSQSAL